jgi:cell division protein FtsW (lipid II flippase)
MEKEKPISDSLQKELDATKANEILSPAYQKRKLILWLIRNSILVVLYILFWKYEWVRWSLYVTVPLAMLSLMTIVFVPYLLRRKLENTKRKIVETENLLDNIEDE